MEGYIEIRKDEHYAEYVKYNKIDHILENFNVNQDKEYGRYCLIINGNIVRIELIKCDKNGNYELDANERENWNSFNLIEFNYPKKVSPEVEEQIKKIVKDIAKLLNWEIYTS